MIAWIKVSSYEQMSEIAADIFTEQLAKKPDSVLGLATGGSPLGFYKEMVRRCQAEEISFARATTFNLDEYVGKGSGDATSYHKFMCRNLFRQIDLPETRHHLPDGLAEDLAAECVRYEKLIEASGGIDLQLLGIGVNGHIGFNEPGSRFDSRTQVIELTEATRKSNARYFEKEEDIPAKAITMGIETIMSARKIVLLAFGANKTDAVERLKSGAVTEEFPASVLHKHPHVTVIYGK
ncbi:glucosamine-6-phosphate deaminase [Planomicrobium okeanokoites]|uniref:glucosamine-6-phosphate deaminase n=1 Tax=Planomicrobium okeanokoites TaxID=244 RepID=UPI002492E46A|nr:glucosamine-6-phosphate deaminase [Planomicrobium okeanokoites]